MNDREVLSGSPRHVDSRDPFGWRGERGEKRERKMAHGVAKFGAVRSVPGIDGIERFQLGDASAFDDAQQIESGVGNRAGAVGETDQGEHRTRGPDFGIGGPGGFESGKREYNVADGAGADEKPARAIA
ncbi:MAG: hypothetical protein JWO19_4294 [Bryobacterales bacterium]|nr:hypothetical protein [Bryobacterales bacterium]